MKCYCCGGENLESRTHDLVHNHHGKTTVISDVSGMYCPDCKETILEKENAMIVSKAMLEFNEKENKMNLDKMNAVVTALLALVSLVLPSQDDKIDSHEPMAKLKTSDEGHCLLLEKDNYSRSRLRSNFVYTKKWILALCDPAGKLLYQTAGNTPSEACEKFLALLAEDTDGIDVYRKKVACWRCHGYNTSKKNPLVWEIRKVKRSARGTKIFLCPSCAEIIKNELPEYWNQTTAE